LRIRRPVSVEDRGKRISILPAESFRLTCEIDFAHPLVGRQSVELEVTPERYAAEIAPARTFGFEYELGQMRNMGLIRGASLENAVCFTREGVLNPGGLRAADECCAGHAMHAALVARIMSDPSLYEILTFDQLASRVTQALVS
jgi:UDP-3-O-[3-hydroxymyristoyl] N-acetylglucosamine deacetylase